MGRTRRRLGLVAGRRARISARRCSLICADEHRHETFEGARGALHWHGACAGMDMAHAFPRAATGLITRQTEPRNLETPLAQVDSFITPTELFYIRCHFQAPTLDRASYRLQVDGAVRTPLSLPYAELRRMRSETRMATLECAGNSRVFLVRQVRGAQWETGAVGNAEWTGVPLATVLERAGLDERACDILLEGADRVQPLTHDRNYGTYAIDHAVPIEVFVDDVEHTPA